MHWLRIQRSLLIPLMLGFFVLRWLYRSAGGTPSDRIELLAAFHAAKDLRPTEILESATVRYVRASGFAQRQENQHRSEGYDD